MKMCMTRISSLTSNPITDEDYHGMAMRIVKQEPDDFRTMLALVSKITEVEGADATDKM